MLHGISLVKKKIIVFVLTSNCFHRFALILSFPVKLLYWIHHTKPTTQFSNLNSWQDNRDIFNSLLKIIPAPPPFLKTNN
jgi:hypothetical protein